MKTLMANGEVLMCDKCEKNPAQYYVQGLTHLALYDGLCAKCCADFLRANGDTVGADKFDKVGA